MVIWHVMIDSEDNDSCPTVFSFTTKEKALAYIRKRWEEVIAKTIDPSQPVEDPSLNGDGLLYQFNDSSWYWLTSSKLED